jgi:hypothetical protein
MTVVNKPKPKNAKLYSKVKKEADDKFLAKTSIYKSAWITRRYKKLGGEYTSATNKESGLTRWFKEKWVDINRPKKNGGYHPCGRPSPNDLYPLCRPTVRVSSKTPKLLSEIPLKIIKRNQKEKKKIKQNGRVNFHI